MSENIFYKKANWSFRVSMFLYIVQIALIYITTIWIVPSHKTAAPVVGVLLSLPLLILLPWLVRRNIRAFIWLCFLQLGYFMPATQHMFMYQQYGVMPFIETAVIIALFCVAMVFSRWEQKRFGISVTR